MPNVDASKIETQTFDWGIIKWLVSPDITPGANITFGQVVLSAFRRQAVSSPLLRLPSDSLCYAFNLVRIPTTGSPADRI